MYTGKLPLTTRKNWIIEKVVIFSSFQNYLSIPNNHLRTTIFLRSFTKILKIVYFLNNIWFFSVSLSEWYRFHSSQSLRDTQTPCSSINGDFFWIEEVWTKQNQEAIWLLRSQLRDKVAVESSDRRRQVQFEFSGSLTGHLFLPLYGMLNHYCLIFLINNTKRVEKEQESITVIP